MSKQNAKEVEIVTQTEKRYVKSTNPFLPYPDIVDTISSPEMLNDEEEGKNKNDQTIELFSKMIEKPSTNIEDHEEKKDAEDQDHQETVEQENNDAFKKLIEENEKLKRRLIEEEAEKKKIISINHDWDGKYKLLKESNATINQEVETLKKTNLELNETLAKKDIEITNLTKHNGTLMKALEETYDSKYGRDDETTLIPDADDSVSDSSATARKKHEDKKLDENGTVEMLLTDAKRERDTILKREQEAIRIGKELESKNYQLHVLLVEEIKRKQDLQMEFDRITILLERELQSKNMGMAAAGSDALNNNVDLQGKLVLLQQQLSAYKEDFSIEKNEKLKLSTDNDNLKQDILKLKETNEHLYRQLQIYEEDFYRERQKRIQLMRRYSNNTPTNGRMPSPPSPSIHSYPGSTHSSILGAHGVDDQQRYKEYCSLIVEKEQLSDRISELESQGVLRYGGRQNLLGGSLPQQSYQNRQLPTLPLSTPQGATASNIPYSPDNWHFGDCYVTGIPPSDAGSSYRGSSISYSSKPQYQHDYDIAR